MEVILEEGGRPDGDAGVDVGGELAEHLQRAAILFPAIAAGDVEVEPVALGFGEEVGPILEVLPVEEFILAEPMHRLDIAVVGVAEGGMKVWVKPWLSTVGLKP